MHYIGNTVPPQGTTQKTIDLCPYFLFLPKHLSVLSDQLSRYLSQNDLLEPNLASRRVTQPKLLFFVSQRLSALPKLTLSPLF
jgi:hypothetical protein